ncbi:MAG: beta-eliminating lyase-related protein [Pseudomonadota bacterium]
MSFASDNWAGASDKVMAFLQEANTDLAPAYGGDPWTGRAIDALAAYFEHDVAAFFVATGSAANGLALATIGKSAGVTFCHVDAHVTRDEAGGPMLYAPGTAFDTVDGPAGRIDPGALAARLADYPEGFVHHGRPAAVSITNVNEIGQCYTVAEVAEIAAIAKGRGCALHMDGARFSNALAHLGVSPADLTWRAGVDVISLGLTKTGGWAAEAVVFFDPALREEAMYRHKQAAQLFSKNRFAAAQVLALLGDGHALALARHANTMGAAVADVLREADVAELAHEPHCNQVFAYVAPAAVERLNAAGIVMAPWHSRSAHLPGPPAPDHGLWRFVASFRTTEADIDTLRTAIAG